MAIDIYALFDKFGDVVRYIGQTTTGAHRRLIYHRSAARSGKAMPERLREWLLSYEVLPDALGVRVLESVETQGEADAAEAKWISIHSATVLNQASGGRVGFRHSDASRAAMSESHTGKVLSPEHAAKLAAVRAATPRTEEWAANISAAKKGKAPRAPGFKHSPETIAKMKAAHAGKKLSAEHVEKIRALKTGVKMSEETRAKMRASAIAARARRKAAAQGG